MRAGIDGLSQRIQDSLGRTPCDGSAYAFRNRRQNRLKLLIWDGTGVWLCQRRLHRGHFTWPRANDNGNPHGTAMGLAGDRRGMAAAGRADFSCLKVERLDAYDDSATGLGPRTARSPRRRIGRWPAWGAPGIVPSANDFRLQPSGCCRQDSPASIFTRRGCAVTLCPALVLLSMPTPVGDLSREQLSSTHMRRE
jgi:hypothetical protein